VEQGHDMVWMVWYDRYIGMTFLLLDFFSHDDEPRNAGLTGC
jgi:hypothetical protein